MNQIAQAQDVVVLSKGTQLHGVLATPADPIGIVIFSHGSGSGRHSPRNRFVAERLNGANIATLLLDLLTSTEDTVYSTRFDIELLTLRLHDAVRYVKQESAIARLPIGLFGASTGAASALNVAAAEAIAVRAVVSRGGRPDLTDPRALSVVQAPTLLIVGGHDYGVIELNQAAYAKLTGTKELAIVPGATHLFEEPGTLATVARLSAQWFEKYLLA